MSKLLQKLMVSLIKFYRNMLSPLKLHTCRFYPSCSSYAIETIEKHGPYKGLLKFVLRLLKCNPFNRGGYDPV